ncbi:hypothetical protein Cgig2_032206 [Carnegiea gigantea]|uniref:Ubiquitin-like protease family profile domain-containing protein n=1 Tax=Carnegiea gigantea TaxID=171969 RepID=A0A9Q1K3Z6_9CARY|nr:hypothetical protein Cgig2_032206 [Carnegiea gigantea]
MVDASLLLMNTGTAHSTEPNNMSTIAPREPALPQGRDEKMGVVVVAADATGSRTADAAGSPSAGGQPPIRQAVHNSFLRTMSAEDVELLCAMRKRIIELNEEGVEHISAFDVKGLVKAMSRGDPGDKAGDYYINNFVLMPLYDGLARHWLLMAVDLKRRHMAVYDSLSLTRATDQQHRQGLLTHAVKRLSQLSLTHYAVIKLC